MSEHPQLQSWASSAIWPLRSYLLCSPGLYPADTIFFSHIPISSISQSVLVTLTRSTSPSGKIRSAPPYAISPSYCFVDLLFSAKWLAGPSVALPLLHVAFSCNPLHVTFRCPYSTMFALVTVTSGLHVARFRGPFPKVSFYFIYWQPSKELTLPLSWTIFSLGLRSPLSRFSSFLTGFLCFRLLPLVSKWPFLPSLYIILPTKFHYCYCFKYHHCLQLWPPSGIPDSYILFHLTSSPRKHLKFSVWTKQNS